MTKPHYGVATHCLKGHDLRAPGVRGTNSPGYYFCTICRDIQKAKKYAATTARRREEAKKHDWASGKCPNGHAINKDNPVHHTAKYHSPYCMKCKIAAAQKANQKPQKPAERCMSAADSERFLELQVELERAPDYLRDALRYEMARIKQGVA